MPKAQSKGCQRKNRIQQRPGVNEQQIDSEDKEGDLQDSCSTLGLTKNAIDEKNSAFFRRQTFLLRHRERTVRRPCVHRAVPVQ